MSTTGSIIGCLCGLLSLGAFDVWAEDRDNPYQLIVDRNAFGLKPPPPKPEPPSTTPPPPTVKVTLSGITSGLFGPNDKRSLWVYSEQEPGKQASSKSCILREGEREGPIEIISIDAVANIVRMKISGTETNMTFEVQKSAPTPAPAPGGPPGIVPRPAMASINPNPAGIPSPLGASANAGPTIITRNTSGDRSGISVMGGTAPSSVPAPMTTSASLTRYGGYGGVAPGVFGAPAAAVATDGTGLSLPTRTVRTETGASTAGGAQTAAKPLDPVSQIIQMRAAEMRAKQSGIPFPPSPPIQGLDD